MALQSPGSGWGELAVFRSDMLVDQARPVNAPPLSAGDPAW
jgi:hypothetical protein